MAHFSIQSNTHNTASPVESLYAFMGDFNNFKHLLPDDKIENFTCTSNQCSFGIKGMTTLTILLKEKDPNTRITFQTSGLANFVFTLHIHFGKTPQDNCQVEIEGDINPFIRMMAEKPLKELVETMSVRLAALQPNALS